jgi:hypothetical protein
LVCNKADSLPAGEAERRALEHEGVAVSALDKTSLAPLLDRAEHMLFVARGEYVELGDERRAAPDEQEQAQEEEDAFYAAQLEE